MIKYVTLIISTLKENIRRFVRFHVRCSLIKITIQLAWRRQMTGMKFVNNIFIEIVFFRFQVFYNNVLKPTLNRFPIPFCIFENAKTFQINNNSNLIDTSKYNKMIKVLLWNSDSWISIHNFVPEISEYLLCRTMYWRILWSTLKVKSLKIRISFHIKLGINEFYYWSLHSV